ncbi:hypothetical protein VTK56DRAFT_2658 [Thermocarpiscus australiensis]
MGASAATYLPNFSLSLADNPSTRYPSHASTAIAMTSPSDSGPGAPRASPLASAATRAAFLTPLCNAAPLPSTSTITNTTNASSSSVLTGSEAAPVGTSSSGVHSTGPQSSQPGGPPVYHSNYMSGSWPTPGGSHLGAYSYANANSGNTNSGPLAQPPYTRGPSLYGPTSSSLQNFAGRGPPSASNAENLPPPQSYQDQPAFSSSVASGGGGTGGGSGTLGSPLSSHTQGGHSGLSQPILSNPASGPRPGTSGQNTSGAPAHAQEGSSHRNLPAPTSCYPPTSTPQQSSFPPFASPVTHASASTAPPSTSSGPMQRGLASIPAMAPPLQFSGGRARSGAPMASYASYGQIPGPVLSNMHHPGAPLAMVGGMQGLPGYGHHAGLPPHQPHHLYPHHHSRAPSQQQDRPFKCDQCPQSFNRNHDLKRHKRIHMAIKPYPCTFCDKRFSRKDALKRHRLVKGCENRLVPNAGAATTGADDGPSHDRSDAVSDDREGSPSLEKKD